MKDGKEKRNKLLIAHIRKDEEDVWGIHTLREHLEGTAKLSSEFARAFGLEKLANIIGIVHDFGKASKAFQNKIAAQSGFDPTVSANRNVDHSTAGAQYLYERYGELGYVLAYTVAGHHGGLPNGIDETDSNLAKRLKKEVKDYKKSIFGLDIPEKIHITDFKTAKSKGSSLILSFLVRMLYSCLVDADFLDTESFMSPKNTVQRSTDKNLLSSFQLKISKYLALFEADTFINKKRAEIYEWCRFEAQKEPGLFSLTVPTGGGKTLSSMAFALDHAVKNKLCRVIYVIPYTSIIIQNAHIFRSIFGSDNVLEHHSNLDPEIETPINKLSSQNWDSPIIVTTNVQFFESFYSNRSSSCRKLHNVANSVIIFDEVQMFPTEYLKPVLSVINELVDNYGCSAVLCTATQPVLSDSSILGKNSLSKVREIIPDPKRLYKQFNRVKINRIKEPMNKEMIVKNLLTNKQVLVIVNTRKDAREIMEYLCSKVGTEDNYHLSTMMCPEHRKKVLMKVRERLESGEACRVVSTQLIEAGVDLDFPAVYRAVAGLDSIAQAAGRCNRNGKMKVGNVYIFKGESKPPIGYLRQAAESGERIIQKKKYESDPLSLDAVTDYFHDFYWKQNSTHKMDKHEIMSKVNSKPKYIPFRDISSDFKMIREDNRSVIVPYGEEGRQLVDELKKWAEKSMYFKVDKQFIPREMQRKAQRFSIQLRVRVFNELVGSGAFEDLFNDGQYWILEREDLYKETVGLVTDTCEYIKAENLIL